MSTEEGRAVSSAVPRRLTILINALSACMGGGISLARSLTRWMASLREDYDFILLYSHSAVAREGFPKNVDARYLPRLQTMLLRVLWEQTVLPTAVRRCRADLLVNLGGFTAFTVQTPQLAVWQNANTFWRATAPRTRRFRAYIRIQRAAQSLSMRKAAQNVFLTRSSVDLAGDHWPMDRIPHTVVNSGIELGDRFQEAYESCRRDHVALAVGHTYYHKNYEKLFEAMSVYREKYPDPLRLVVVGGAYDRDYHAGLKQRIVELDLGDRIEMVGPESSDQVLERLRTAKVYVTTSILETFGLTVLEAMAAGLPVVASDATCLPEVCGDAALLCDPHDPLDIARKLHQAASDADTWTRLRAAGLARVQQMSWRRSAEAYLFEIERLLKGANARSGALEKG